MHTQEEFIDTIMQGGEVRIEDIAQSQFELELSKLKSIAAQRLVDEKTERERVNRRKLEISEMLELDAETRRLSDESEENYRQCLEAMQPFADRELEIRAASDKKWSKFNQIYHKLNGAAYNHPFVTTPLSIELKEMGAVLTAIDNPLHKSPSSPPTSLVLDYRKFKKY
jgi:hypothetical protein